MARAVTVGATHRWGTPTPVGVEPGQAHLDLLDTIHQLQRPGWAGAHAAEVFADHTRRAARHDVGQPPCDRPIQHDARRGAGTHTVAASAAGISKPRLRQRTGWAQVDGRAWVGLTWGVGWALSRLEPAPHGLTGLFEPVQAPRQQLTQQLPPAYRRRLNAMLGWKIGRLAGGHDCLYTNPRVN